MIRSAILAAAASAVLASVAVAADLPTTKGPPVYTPPPPPPFSWTGVYVGGQVGYEWGTSDGSFTQVVPPVVGAAVIPGGTFFRSFGHNAEGVVGGGHIGYNYQINQFVVGVEGDVNGSSYEGSGLIAPAFVLLARERTEIDASIRGRIGVAFDRALVYATGGVAFAGFETSLFDTATGFGETHHPGRAGWTVGGGVEYAIDDNWSVRAEYRYTNYGTFDATYTTLTTLPTTITYHATDNRVQVGFSYKFGEPPPPAPPVVAKY